MMVGVPRVFPLTDQANDLPEELKGNPGSLFESVLWGQYYGGATHAAVWDSEDGDSVRCAFFESGPIFWRRLMITNATGASADQVRALLRTRRARAASLQLVPEGHPVADSRSSLSKRYRASNDVIIALPADLPAYLSNLGDSTRKNLLKYERRLARNASWSGSWLEKGEMSEESISEVALLSKMRTEAKGEQWGLSQDWIRQRLPLFKRYGKIYRISVDGKVIAGTIFLIYGDEAFAIIVAHDPAYDREHAGLICMYETIKHFIEQGCSRYHFMWGYGGHKFRLGGVDTGIDRIEIYASPLARLMEAPSYTFASLARWAKLNLAARWPQTFRRLGGIRRRVRGLLRRPA